MGLHRVHPDTVARPFDAKRLGEIAKRPSGGGLVRAQRLFGRADKDNRPAAPRRAAMGGEILRQQEALIEPAIKRRAPLIVSKLVRGHVPRQRRDVALTSKGGHFDAGRAANALLRARLTDFGEGAALYDERVRLVAI